MKYIEKLLLGAHMSIAGGLSESITRGESIGCTAIQIFTKSNRQWSSQELSPEEIKKFKERQKNSTVKIVIAHASYLINLGSPDPDIFRKSVIAATKELLVCEDLAIPYLVLHPGSYTTSSPEVAIQSIAHGIEKIFNHVPGKTMILLETMAGQGTTIGKTFAELAAIRNLIKDKNRVGICLDTCHVFAAGYDISTKKGYEKLWSEFDTMLGIEQLKAIHLNDSKKECGSHVDRHENIGEGLIGKEGFSFLMNDPALAAIPKILETPKSSLEDDKQNMGKLINMILSK